LALRRVGPPIFLRDRERDTKKFPQSVPWFGFTFPVVASPGRSPGVVRRGAEGEEETHPNSKFPVASVASIVAFVVVVAPTFVAGCFSRCFPRVGDFFPRGGARFVVGFPRRAGIASACDDGRRRPGRRARASRLLVWKTCFLFVWFNSMRTFRLERLFLPFHGS